MPSDASAPNAALFVVPAALDAGDGSTPATQLYVNPGVGSAIGVTVDADLFVSDFASGSLTLFNVTPDFNRVVALYADQGNLGLLIVDPTVDGGAESSTVKRPRDRWFHVTIVTSFVGQGTSLSLDRVEVLTTNSGMSGVTAGYYLTAGLIARETTEPGKVIYDNIVVRPILAK